MSAENDYELTDFRWGLVPFWAKDLKIGARMINARSETVATKPSFRSAFKCRRCLVLADGFFEWKKNGKKKQPFYISRSDDQPFLMAGLWESWRDKSDPDAAHVETCTILTTEANAIMEPLHDRMPVILSEESFELWLDPEFENRDKLQSLLVPSDPEELQTFAVSTVVNKAGNDVPECIEPLKELF